MPSATLQPTSNTSPDPGQGGDAVTDPTNTGHGSTTALAVGADTDTKTCLWTTFQSIGGQILSLTLKVDFEEDGVLSDGGADTSNDFFIEYSLNGGSSWSALRASSQIQAPNSGTAQVALSTSQDLTQVRVRDSLHANSIGGESATVTATTSSVRIEALTAAQAAIVMM